MSHKCWYYQKAEVSNYHFMCNDTVMSRLMQQNHTKSIDFLCRCQIFDLIWGLHDRIQARVTFMTHFVDIMELYYIFNQWRGNSAPSWVNNYITGGYSTGLSAVFPHIKEKTLILGCVVKAGRISRCHFRPSQISFIIFLLSYVAYFGWI